MNYGAGLGQALSVRVLLLVQLRNHDQVDGMVNKDLLDLIIRSSTAASHPRLRSSL